MAVNIDIRSLESSVAAEIYISATPAETAAPQNQGQEIFSRIRDILHSKKARILQERVFATQKTIQLLCPIRAEIYGDIDDGVAPSLLVPREGTSGPLAGVQVHAVSTDSEPAVIDLHRTPCGRILHLPGCTYLTLSNVSAPPLPAATDQARAMLEKAEAILKKFDTDFLSVARTWMWLGDILAWYDDFNEVRTKFFTQRGLIGKDGRQSMPASTGVGIRPADGSNCAMDLIAVPRPPHSIQYLPAVGKQQCALEYGSAFSRASRAITPAGQTVFVSGTASIDATGATTNIDDPAGQITATLENVRAVLKDMQATDEHVVQVMTYCKTTEVERIFNDLKARLRWPCVTAIGDICRPELLFEVEATAVVPKNP